MLTVSSIYVLRWTRPDLPRPFRTPGYPVVPAIFLTVTAILTVAAFVERPRVSIYSLLSILAGIPVYYFWLRPRGRAARREVEGLKPIGSADPERVFGFGEV